MVSEWIYYWEWCKRFGYECYHRWRGMEITSSILVTLISVVLTHDSNSWEIAVTAIEANVIVFGLFALGHLFKTSFLLFSGRLHVSGGGIREINPKFGLLGLAVVAAYRSYCLPSSKTVLISIAMYQFARPRNSCDPGSSTMHTASFTGPATIN